MVNQSRPVFLNLLRMRFPITAVVSILHRISGFALFLMMPFILCWWRDSLRSPEQFAAIKLHLTQLPLKILVGLITAGLVYHLFAGLRHIIMDCGYGESLTAARRSAAAVLVLSFVTIVILGIKLWL